MRWIHERARSPKASRRSLLALGLLGAVLAAGTAGAAATTAPPSLEPGSWQSHQLEFQFVGFTTTYSCDGLEAKLRLLLQRVGARPGFSVDGFGCSRGSSMPDHFARARLNFATLQPLSATAAAGSAGAAAETPVAGLWTHVQLAPHRPQGLDTGDCELMEQFRDRVLPLFTTHAVQNQISCVPHQVPTSFSLSFEVFAPPGKG
jgi:hypothetical protein